MEKTVFHQVPISSLGKNIYLSVAYAHPKATTLLFYPGTMASPYMYPTLMQAFHNMGLNVVGIHLMGHGLSEKNKSAFTVDDLLQNGRHAENFARQTFKGPLVVAGHSQGGILTLAHCIDNTSIAAAFPMGTLLPHTKNAGSVTRFSSILQHKELLLKFVNAAATIAPSLPTPFLAYLELKRILANAYKAYAPRKHCRSTYPLRFIHSLFSLNLEKATQQGHIHCPIFLLTAKDDALFSLSLMQETLELIAAPYKKLICIHGGGHLFAVSKLYAQHAAAHVAGQCASLGLPLYIQKARN